MAGFDPDARNVAVSLRGPLLAPPGVMHYAPGPVTLRQFQHEGTAWLAVYEAQHDGRGWLVMRTFCRPLVLLAGDLVHLRAEMVSDQGDVIEVAFAGAGRVTKFVPRAAVVFLEERVAAGPGQASSAPATGAEPSSRP